MVKLKEIKNRLGKEYYSESDNRQQIFVKSCVVGDNFYDYGETRPKK